MSVIDLSIVVVQDPVSLIGLVWLLIPGGGHDHDGVTKVRPSSLLVFLVVIFDCLADQDGS